MQAATSAMLWCSTVLGSPGSPIEVRFLAAGVLIHQGSLGELGLAERGGFSSAGDQLLEGPAVIEVWFVNFHPV